MIRRFHEAKVSGQGEVVCWGSGTPMREFLHVDDLAQACLHLMDVHNETGWVNVGTGEDVTIRTLAETVAATVGYSGTIAWDTSKPDGTPRKLLDVSKMTALGWTASTPLDEGIREVYQEFLQALEGSTLRG